MNEPDRKVVVGIRIFALGVNMSSIEKKAIPQQALQAFQRDLPELWCQRPRQWVAYQGDRRIGFATQKHDLYHLCFEQGLHRDEFVIFSIEAQETEVNLGPVIVD